MAFEDFVSGFVGCALWLGKSYATEKEAEEGNGTNLDEVCDDSDIPADVMTEIRNDCEGFYDNHSHLWAGEPNYDDSSAGHDFFLSRNGHGAGFWDRGLEHGDELHDATKPYGSFGLEQFGEDAPIHSHG